jgi:hypothetical protein
VTITAMILEYVRTNPGATRAQMLEYLPKGTKAGTVSGLTTQMAARGLIENRGVNGRGARWYTTDFSVSPTHLLIAQDLLDELDKGPSTCRDLLLAQRLEEIFG